MKKTQQERMRKRRVKKKGDQYTLLSKRKRRTYWDLSQQLLYSLATVKKRNLAVTHLVQFSDVLLLPLLQQLCNLVVTLHLSSCEEQRQD